MKIDRLERKCHLIINSGYFTKIPGEILKFEDSEYQELTDMILDPDSGSEYNEKQLEDAKDAQLATEYLFALRNICEAMGLGV